MPQEPADTHLFVLRLWKENEHETSIEYRGRVQHVLNGETRHFRDWTTLIEFLMAQMEQSQKSNDGSDQVQKGGNGRTRKSHT